MLLVEVGVDEVDGAAEDDEDGIGVSPPVKAFLAEMS